MAPKIVLNGVTAQEPDAVEEGATCLALVPRLVHAEVVPVQGSLAIHDDATEGADAEDDDDDEEDSDEILIKGYKLLGEVEEELFRLLHRTATPMTKTTRDRLTQLGADVNSFLTTYEDFGSE